MNTLDLIIVIAAIGYGIAGFWNGLLTSVSSIVGMVTGLTLGALIAPLLLFGAAPGQWASVFTVTIVLGITATVQTLFSHVANRTRDRVESAPLRLADAAAGGIVGALGNAAVIALLAGAIINIPNTAVSETIKGSAIVAKAEELKPGGTDMVASQFVDLIDSTGFTLHADPFIPDIAPAVEAADERILKGRKVKRAGKSVLRVAGVNACDSIVEGTAFLYAPNRMMTNAHVVSGVVDPEVLMPWGPAPAKVVYFDDKTDLAVLAVDSRGLTPLEFDATGSENDQAVAMGYPEFGDFHASAIRVRSEQNLRTGDVHGDGTVVRDVFTLRGDVRPGNSGGPLVSEEGTVIGVIFANSLTGTETAYAMTAEQAAAAAAAGISATKRVDAGTCITP